MESQRASSPVPAAVLVLLVVWVSVSSPVMELPALVVVEVWEVDSFSVESVVRLLSCATTVAVSVVLAVEE